MNNFHYTANNIKIGNLDLLSGCLYTNINNTQEYPIIKLVLATINYKRKSNNNKTNFLIFTYSNNKRVTLLNDCDN